MGIGMPDVGAVFVGVREPSQLASDDSAIVRQDLQRTTGQDKGCKPREIKERRFLRVGLCLFTLHPYPVGVAASNPI